MKPPPHLFQSNQSNQSNNNAYTATVSLSQQQSNNNNNNFMNSLLQPPSIPPPIPIPINNNSNTNTSNSIPSSSSSSSLTSLTSNASNSTNNNNQDNNNNNSSQLPPRKESINILFTRKESYYTLPADGSTPIINNSPTSQSMSPSSTYINSSNFSSVRRDSFNLPELSLGPSAATDMDLYLRNTDLHNEH